MNLFFKNHKHLTRLTSTFNRFVSSNLSKQPRALFSSFASDLLEPDSWKSMEGLVRCKANYAPLSPISFLERSATVYRDRTSVVYGSLKFTWAETHQRCLKLASALSQLGISRGDVVSLFFCLFFFFPAVGFVRCFPQAAPGHTNTLILTRIHLLVFSPFSFVYNYPVIESIFDLVGYNGMTLS
jgi:hypothetical protein